MSNTYTGGPAFPHITESGKYVYEEGMTLRDYDNPSTSTRIAYEIADAMLKGGAA